MCEAVCFSFAIETSNFLRDYTAQRPQVKTDATDLKKFFLSNIVVVWK